MTKRMHIYLLPYYANKGNLVQNTYETTHESKVSFDKGSISIELSEVNSLVEERYCLCIKSARFEIIGGIPYGKTKESMIHHHPTGHPWKHLQFKLSHGREVIRIPLEPTDEEDYTKCIKGFLHICKDLILLEKEENGLKENLLKYFFSDEIYTLASLRKFLLEKIKNAYHEGKILDRSNEVIQPKRLYLLKSEPQLSPFLDWDALYSPLPVD